MRNLIGITHRVVVEPVDIGILAYTDVIADAEVPGYLEGQITVFIGLSLITTTLTTATALGLLHLLVDVGVTTIVPLIVFFLFLLLAFLLLVVVDILTAQTLDPVADLLVAQVIGEVLRKTRETTELALLPIGSVVADLWTSQTVELVDVRGEGGTEVQGIALRELQAQGGLEVAQGAAIGHEVITHAKAQLVDQTDLLEACGVFI